MADASSVHDASPTSSEPPVEAPSWEEASSNAGGGTPSSMQPSHKRHQELLSQIHLLKSSLPTQAELALVYEYSSEEGKKFERYIQGVIQKIRALNNERLSLSAAEGGPEQHRESVRKRHAKLQEVSHMTAVYEFLNKEANISERSREVKRQQQRAQAMQSMKRDGLLEEAKTNRVAKERERLAKLEEKRTNWLEAVCNAESAKQQVTDGAKKVRDRRLKKLADVERVTFLGVNNELPGMPVGSVSTASDVLPTMSEAGGSERSRPSADSVKIALEKRYEQQIEEHLQRARIMKLHRTSVANNMVGHVKELLVHIKERRAEEDELKYQRLQEKCAEGEDRYRGVLQRKADTIRALREKSLEKEKRIRENREVKEKEREEKRAQIGTSAQMRHLQAEQRLQRRGSPNVSPPPASADSELDTSAISNEEGSQGVQRKHVSQDFYEARRGKLAQERINQRAIDRAAEAEARKNETMQQVAMRLIERTTRVGTSLGVVEVQEKSVRPAVTAKRHPAPSEPSLGSAHGDVVPRQQKNNGDDEKLAAASAARAKRRDYLARRAKERLEAEAEINCSTREPQKAEIATASAGPNTPSEILPLAMAPHDSPAADEPPPPPHLQGRAPVSASLPPNVTSGAHPVEAENPIDESPEVAEVVDFPQGPTPTLPTLAFLLTASTPLSSIPVGERTVAHELHNLRTMYLTMRQEQQMPPSLL